MKIFIDTCVVRFSQEERRQWLKQKEPVNLFGKLQEVEIVRGHVDSPQDKIDNDKQLRDAKASVEIAKLLATKQVQGVWQFETLFEWGRTKKMGISAPSINQYMEVADPPCHYTRVLFDPDQDVQFNFLRNLNQERYVDWKKACGVVKGSKKELNQLMDAWNLWSAEHNECDFFLTVDYKLIRSVNSRNIESNLELITPTEFINRMEYAF
jgi:hypothetical protein